MDYVDNEIAWDKLSKSAKEILELIPREKRGPAGKILFDLEQEILSQGGIIPYCYRNKERNA